MIGVKTYKNLNNCSGQYWYNIEIKWLTEKLIETKTEMNFKTEISLVSNTIIVWTGLSKGKDFVYIDVLKSQDIFNTSRPH